MKARVLIFLNFIGCLLLVGVIVVQWSEERKSDSLLETVQSDLTETRAELDEERRRVLALERDINLLKQSLELTQREAETAADSLELETARAGKLETDLEAASDQLGKWEDAVTQRDEQIRKLDAELAEARKRLDEAVKRLNAAAQ